MTCLKGVLFAAVIGVSMLAPIVGKAETLACGVFGAEDGSSELTVTTDRTASLRGDYQPLQALAYRVEGEQVRVFDLEYGFEKIWHLQDRGTRLRTDMGTTYVLASPAKCDEAPPVPRDGCRADLQACFGRQYEADVPTLTQWCEKENLPFACISLIKELQNRVVVVRDDRAATRPAVCREGTPGADEEACKELVAQELAGRIAGAFQNMHADPAPLQAADLDRLPAFCENTRSLGVCSLVAEKLWSGGRYAQARNVLADACVHTADRDTCRKAELLQGLNEEDLDAPLADALPCGRYVAETGLLTELDFGDRGMVTYGEGERMRARLEQGRVRIRHDRGGDFVFRPVGADQLLGVDTWTRFVLYQRQPGGAAECAPPVEYDERPLQKDCPAAAGGADAMESCCRAGKLQGCIGLAHGRALAGDWAGAQPYYQKICDAKVRVGCENLVTVYANTDDESVPEAMDALCRKDPRHVACDVLETTNWEQVRALRALQEFGRAVERDLRRELESE